MPEITNGTVVFDDADLKWFTKYYDETEWAVYVYGMDEVHTCQDSDLADNDPANPPHTEATARATAEYINTKLQPVREFDPQMAGVVLHFGAPEPTTVGA